MAIITGENTGLISRCLLPTAFCLSAYCPLTQPLDIRRLMAPPAGMPGSDFKGPLHRALAISRATPSS